MITGEIKRHEGLPWVGAGIFLGFSAWQVDIGSFREPGPGFIAFIGALSMVAVGTIMFFAGGSAKRPKHEDGDSAQSSPSASWPRVLYTIGFLFGYAVLLDPLGYILTTFLVLWGLFYDWRKRNWLSSLVVSAATTVISYLLFEKLLGLRFPTGILS